MNIYRINLPEGEGCYDGYNGHIIAAKNSDDVIKLAKEKAADEGKDIWNESIIELIGTTIPGSSYEGILLSDFSVG